MGTALVFGLRVVYFVQRTIVSSVVYVAKRNAKEPFTEP